MLQQKGITFLLVGGSSWIARHLKSKIPSLHRVYTAGRSSGSDFFVDLENGVYNIPGDLCFDVVIFCAGVGSLDFCEKHPKCALRVNAYGCIELSQMLDNIGTRFVFLSTSQVFGSTQVARSEYESPRPDSVYGESKLYGEKYFQKHPGSVILRMSKIIGHDVGFVERLMSSLRSSNPLYALDDLNVSPIHISTVLDLILDVSINSPHDKIIHASGSSEVSYYNFSKMVFELYGCKSDIVRPSTCKESNISYRPLRNGLDCSLVASSSLELDEEIRKLFLF